MNKTLPLTGIQTSSPFLPPKSSSPEEKTESYPLLLVVFQIPEMLHYILSFLSDIDKLHCLSSCKTLYNLKYTVALRRNLLCQRHLDLGFHFFTLDTLIGELQWIVAKLGSTHPYTIKVDHIAMSLTDVSWIVLESSLQQLIEKFHLCPSEVKELTDRQQKLLLFLKKEHSEKTKSIISHGYSTRPPKGLTVISGEEYDFFEYVISSLQKFLPQLQWLLTHLSDSNKSTIAKLLTHISDLLNIWECYADPKTRHLKCKRKISFQQIRQRKIFKDETDWKKVREFFLSSLNYRQLSK